MAWHVVFLEDGPMVADCRDRGATCEVIPSGRIRQPLAAVRCIRELARSLKSNRADVAVSWMSKPHLYAGPAAKLAGVPAMWFQHGLPSGRVDLDWWVTKLPARGILACSATVAAAQGRLRPARPIRVVLPGVELDRFDPDRLPTAAECRHRLGLPPTGTLIGIAGRLQRWKGVHTVIDAVPLLLATYPDLQCVVVGGVHDLEPTYADEVAQQVKRLRLERHVTLAGFQRNVPEWMRAMDVVIHASDREPFGLVVIEAMALGKPVLAGDAGGPTEVITDGVNGLLSPYGDAPALARQVRRYLDDPAFAAAVGAAARARAAEFSVGRYVDRFVEAVKELLRS